MSYIIYPEADAEATGTVPFHPSLILHKTYIGRVPEICTKWSYIYNMFDIYQTYTIHIPYICHTYLVFKLT